MRSCRHNHGCIHNMKHLSDQASRKLFFDRIFGSEDACPTELKKASCEILKKCGGLPLAIITMASMLACQTTRLEGQWDYILNSLATKSTTSSNYEEMMNVLDLSYKNLPRHLCWPTGSPAQVSRPLTSLVEHPLVLPSTH